MSGKLRLPHYRYERPMKITQILKSSITFLGILIDCKLNFNDYIDLITGKISRNIFLLKRLSEFENLSFNPLTLGRFRKIGTCENAQRFCGQK